MKRVTVMLVLLACVLAANSTSAQGAYEEQSLAILKLYESGDKAKRDSAYKLIDRLKSDREARFVPVVLFVRGQMTPDDRSLHLYREAIALDPGGQWADDAAAALVRRYAANRDSLGTHTWLAMLKSNYPRSPLVAATQDTVAGISDWKLPEAPVIAPKTGIVPKNDTVRSQVRKPVQSGVQSAVRRDTAKTTKPTSTTKTTSTTTKPSSTTSSVKKPASTSATKSTSTTKPTATKTSTATKPTASKPVTTTTASKTTAKPTAATKPTSATKTVAKPATPKPVSDTALSKLRGYALQVGVFPSKEAAQPRLTELQQKKLQVYALPKFIDGKKQYAVIVGPYPTLDDADNRKAEVAAACNCQAFIVKVE